MIAGLFHHQKEKRKTLNAFMYNIVTSNQLYLAALYWNLFAVPNNKLKKNTNPNTMQHLFMIVKL